MKLKQTITIDIVSDVVCPWCYIGRRRLQSALSELQEEYDFEVEHRPFELNPAIPASGRDQLDYMIEKFGSEERYKSLTKQVTQVAADEGLEFNFDKQFRSPNTRKAHALIQFAASEGRHRESGTAEIGRSFWWVKICVHAEFVIQRVRPGGEDEAFAP